MLNKAEIAQDTPGKFDIKDWVVFIIVKDIACWIKVVLSRLLVTTISCVFPQFVVGIGLHIYLQRPRSLFDQLEFLFTILKCLIKLEAPSEDTGIIQKYLAFSCETVQILHWKQCIGNKVFYSLGVALITQDRTFRFLTLLDWWQFCTTIPLHVKINILLSSRQR